jgi:hypothetical protein
MCKYHPEIKSWSKVRDFGCAQYVTCRVKLDEKNPKYADFTTTFGVIFHIFPIDFPHCCHAFDDSYHGLYLTNL